MDRQSRRDFLKVAGVAALGVGAKPVYDALAVRPPEAPAAGSTPAAVGHEASLKAGRWAMVVDTRKCMRAEGCKDCSASCHAVHNVPEFDDPKNEVKWIWKEKFEGAFPGEGHEFMAEDLKGRNVMLLCNHCNNPPCVRVCPTKATWKRTSDGVVMMDMHRCIGCRYCMAACPYGSRSFNWKDPRKGLVKLNPGFPTRSKGVVEKCNFCEERLDRGQMPACVEACKAGALVFGDLKDPGSEVRRLLARHYSIRRKSGLGTEPEVYYLV